MTKLKYLIVGAGIGGLSAAAYLKEKGEEDFLVVEKSDGVPNNLSNGLHYLHDVDFNIPFPIEFKECILTEQIWDTKNGTFSNTATLPELFAYSRKVMENLRHPSSIMDPGKRKSVWIPESNDMNELIKKYVEYIGIEKFVFKTFLEHVMPTEKIAYLSNSSEKDNAEISYEYLISTAPLDTFTKRILQSDELVDLGLEFKHKKLHITNYITNNIVPNWMIVLYMSDPKFPPYRISCFNNILSMESLNPIEHDDEVIIKYIAGDLFDYDLASKSQYSWETGRIFGISKQQRKQVVEILVKYGIYPIGRFALWNGKLRMDDTIEQAEKLIQRLTSDGYSQPEEVRLKEIARALYE